MTLVIVSGRAYRTLEQHDRGPGIFQPGKHLLDQYTQLTDAAASLIAARRALTAAP